MKKRQLTRTQPARFLAGVLIGFSIVVAVFVMMA